MPTPLASATDRRGLRTGGCKNAGWSTPSMPGTATLQPWPVSKNISDAACIGGRRADNDGLEAGSRQASPCQPGGPAGRAAGASRSDAGDEPNLCHGSAASGGLERAPARADGRTRLGASRGGRPRTGRRRSRATRGWLASPCVGPVRGGGLLSRENKRRAGLFGALGGEFPKSWPSVLGRRTLRETWEDGSAGAGDAGRSWSSGALEARDEEGDNGSPHTAHSTLVRGMRAPQRGQFMRWSVLSGCACACLRTWWAAVDFSRSVRGACQLYTAPQQRHSARAVA